MVLIYLSMYVCMYVLWIIDQPGLLGPHFPQLLCVTGMARAEVLSYFRHAQGELHSYIHTFNAAFFVNQCNLCFKSVCNTDSNYFCMYV
jgi:hypothetical protein